MPTAGLGSEAGGRQVFGDRQGGMATADFQDRPLSPLALLIEATGFGRQISLSTPGSRFLYPLLNVSAVMPFLASRSLFSSFRTPC